MTEIPKGFPYKRIRVTHPKTPDLPSRTRQSDALGADVNSIMDRFIAHGVVEGQAGEARYGDFSSGMDYKTALDQIRGAEADFMDLPAHIRAHVDNDPGKFLDLVYDEDRKEELVELGLLPQQDPTEEPPPPKPSDPPAAPPDPSPGNGGE